MAKKKDPNELTAAQQAAVAQRVADRLKAIDDDIADRKLRRLEEEIELGFLRLKLVDPRLRRLLPRELLPRWSLAQRERLLRATLSMAGVAYPGDEPHVEEWRSHVATLAKSLGTRVQIERSIGEFNAYAWSRRKVIEISPITSATAYGTALHELGHVANPCTSEHKRHRVKKYKSVCCRCEITAWQWAMRQARPSWSIRMHEMLAESIRTYRKYATDEEAREIDWLASKGAYREQQLAHTMKEKR